MKTIGAFTLLLFITVAADAQTELPEALQQHFRDFHYEQTVMLADSALAQPQRFSREQLVQIYELKAAALYSLNQVPEAFSCYLEILKMNPEHRLDPVRTSPKLVGFFEDIKAGFQKMPSPAETMRVDTVRIISTNDSFYRKTVPASLLLPGAGHWLAGNRKKAVPLAVIGAAALSGAVIAAVDCRSKEKNYLNAVEPTAIEARYSSYNSAYRTRNALFIAYAAVWSYAQFDLLFRQKPMPAVRLSVLPQVRQSTLGLNCSLYF